MLLLEEKALPTTYYNSSKSNMTSLLLVCLLIVGTQIAQVSGTSRNLLETQREILCSGWIGVFNETCSPDQQLFSGHVDNNKDSLAVCCRDDSCCKQLNGIIDAGCLDLLDEHPEYGVLETIGLHATVCTDAAHKIPTSLLNKLQQEKVSGPQLKEETETKNKVCDNFSQQLVSQCGFLRGENAIMQVQQGSESFECCWPTSCCSLSKQYYDAGCSPGCEGEDVLDQSYSRRIGSSIAQLWKGACLLDTQDSNNCQNQNVDGEGEDNQVKIMKVSDVEEEQFLSNEVLHYHGDYFFENSLLQEQEGKEECTGLQDVLYHLDIEVQTIQTFCQLQDLSALSAFGNTQITGCCNIAKQVVDGLCQNGECIPELPGFFGENVLEIIFSWQVVCSPQITSCQYVQDLFYKQQQQQQQNQLVSPFPPLIPITHISQTQQTKKSQHFDQLKNLPVFNSDEINYLNQKESFDEGNLVDITKSINLSHDIDFDGDQDNYQNKTYQNDTNNIINMQNNFNQNYFNETISSNQRQQNDDLNQLVEQPNDDNYDFFQVKDQTQQYFQEGLEVEPQLQFLFNKNTQDSKFSEIFIQSQANNETKQQQQQQQQQQFSDQNYQFKPENFQSLIYSQNQHIQSNSSIQQKVQIINDQTQQQNSQIQPQIQNQQNSSYIKINDRSDKSMFDVLGEIPDVLFFNLAAQQINLKQQIQDLNQQVMVFVALDSAFHAFAQKSNLQTQDVIDGIRSGGLTDLINQHIVTQFIDFDLAIQQPVQSTALNGEPLSVFLEVEKESMWVMGCCEPENKAKVLSGSLFQEGLLAVVDTLVMPPDMIDRV